jgi:hypothetical protein
MGLTHLVSHASFPPTSMLQWIAEDMGGEKNRVHGYYQQRLCRGKTFHYASIQGTRKVSSTNVRSPDFDQSLDHLEQFSSWRACVGKWNC